MPELEVDSRVSQFLDSEQNGFDSGRAFQDAAEHHVAAVQPGGLHGRDEELGAVRILIRTTRKQLGMG
jgi:hypothetical protein